MRLIDADKIDFGKIFIGASDFAKDTREAAQNLIDEQPAAYDVDKVIERIENMQDISGWDLTTTQECLKVVKEGLSSE